MKSRLPTVTQDGEERVEMKRTSVPLYLIRVPEDQKNRWIVRKSRAKKVTGQEGAWDEACGSKCY